MQVAPIPLRPPFKKGFTAFHTLLCWATGLLASDILLAQRRKAALPRPKHTRIGLAKLVSRVTSPAQDKVLCPVMLANTCVHDKEA